MATTEDKNTKLKKFILIKKTIKKILFLTVLITLCTIIFIYILKNNKKTKNKLFLLKNKEDIATVKAREIERKAFLTKSYIAIWKEQITDKQKKGDGIDVETVKIFINKIAEKHLLKNININFSLPEHIILKDKKSINMLNTQISITFGCLTEYSLYNFLKDLKKENDVGFFIIEELEIKKVNNIDKQFIKALVNGDINALFNVSLKLQWYETTNGKQ